MEQYRSSLNQELRTEIRKAASEGASVEFKPSKDAMSYRLRLRDWSPSGLGILVRKDSDLCRLIHVGQVFPMMVHYGGVAALTEHIKVEIRHISEPDQGRHPEHCIIGLHILERMN